MNFITPPLHLLTSCFANHVSLCMLYNSVLLVCVLDAVRQSLKSVNVDVIFTSMSHSWKKTEDQTRRANAVSFNNVCYFSPGVLIKNNVSSFYLVSSTLQHEVVTSAVGMTHTCISCTVG